MSYRSTPRHRFALRACAVAVVAALGCAGAASAHAEDLMDAYRQALHSDPTLMQAEAQQRIGHEGMVQSRAVLLPQINGSVSYNGSHGTSTSSQFVKTDTGATEFVDGFGNSEGRSRTASVGLNQVLFDLGKFSQLRASQASAAADAAQYASAQQDLILRVATAYFTVLTDEDQLRFAQANQKSLAKQLDQAQAKYAVGLSAITDADNARAQEAAAAANVIQARTTLFNDREALAQITGEAPVNLKALSDTMPLNPPQPDDADAWVKTALASNPSLQAQRDQVQAAQHDITAARAGHLPTLDASVNYSRSPTWGQDAISPAGLPSNVVDVLRADRRSTDTSLGLVLSVPLFAGGGTQARVRQAIAQRDQARDVLVQDQRQVVATTRNAFNSIKAGISQVKAQKEAVIAAQKALQSTQAGYNVGTQTILEVLNAQQTLFQAQSNYSQARHAYVINELTLKFSAGTLSVDDLEAVNALLQ